MQPGVLAVSSRDGGATSGSVRNALAAAGVDQPTLHEGPGLVVATWGGRDLGPDGHLALSRSPRRHEADLTEARVSTMLGTGTAADFAEMLPPFAAFRRLGAREAVAVTDALGFRHLYRTQWQGSAALSTSVAALAALARRPVDRDSLALQSLLGWQVGQWTLFEGVEKVAPGQLVRLRDGRSVVEDGRRHTDAEVGLDDAVDQAARLLRHHLTAVVTDQPDAVLQLTGGQDSRILLSAIPPELRRGMAAATLSVPGSEDVDIAGDIASRVDLRHQVVALDSLESLDPVDAYELCAESSGRLDAMADPLALAALSVAERTFPQGHRISGLGGEVARGFYYLGSARQRPVTRSRVARLAAWRMFANEAIDPSALTASLRQGAHELAVDRIHALMAATGKEWLAATDDFYLDQRMQRWAGVTDTAVCQERAMINPMLDDRFISIAQALSPRSKRGSLFLARLQMALDPELGRMPLDGRPAPEAYARSGVVNRARSVQTMTLKATAKVRQRARHATRSPAGGTVLAGKVVTQWRRDPSLLDTAREHDVLDHEWLDRLVSGELDPSPSTVAFVLNVAGLPLTHQVPAPG